MSFTYTQTSSTLNLNNAHLKIFGGGRKLIFSNAAAICSTGCFRPAAQKTVREVPAGSFWQEARARTLRRVRTRRMRGAS